MDQLQLFFSGTGMLPIAVKIFLAAFLGGLVGFERESHGQAAGFRTNILVSLGGCLLMLLSLNMEEIFEDMSYYSIIRLDPSRIASYAIAGMGFLGAGAIIKGGGTVRGLTTAASLWLVTGIGLAVGAGFVWPAVLTTLVSLFVLYYFRRLLRPLFTHEMHTVLVLTCRGDPERMEEFRSILDQYKLEVESADFTQVVNQNRVVLTIRIQSKSDLDRAGIMRAIREKGGVEKINWKKAEVP
ncbi:MAG: MgtC/SapB family protein [Desulfovibrionales bacterium]